VESCLELARAAYWRTAAREWEHALARPQLWRAMFEEVGHQAVQSYWTGFLFAKAGLSRALSCHLFTRSFIPAFLQSFVPIPSIVVLHSFIN
jgi:hypothetical protein